MPPSYPPGDTRAETPGRATDPVGTRGRRRRKWLLIALGLAAAVTLLLPSLPYAFAITIIGLPVAVLLLVAPFAFLVAAGTAWIGPRFGGGWKGHGLALVLTLALLALPTALGNRLLERKVAALVAGDHDDVGPLPGRTLALRSSRAFDRDTLRCGDFCLRALLTGAADRVLVLREGPEVAIDPRRQVEAFRIERRDRCPAVKLRRGADPDFIEAPGRRDPDAPRADERMQLEIAQGRCLVTEPAPLADADAVISVGPLPRPPAPAWWNPFGDTTRAQRITLHVRRDGAFAEAFRRTGVVVRKLGPFYAPTAETGSELRAWPVLYGHVERHQLAARDNDRMDLGAFVTGRLGMTLELSGTAGPAETARVLQGALAASQPGRALPQEVGDDLLEGIQRRRAITDEERDVLARLLADPRYAVPSAAASALRVAAHAPAAFHAEVARAMFARLQRLAAEGGATRHPPWARQASNVARVIAVLPPPALAAHRADLEALAATPGALREHADDALPRLADFGVEGGRRLLRLMDEVHASPRARERESWALRARAMEGLCRLGAAGRDLVPEIYARIDAGAPNLNGGHWEAVVRTLTAMGETPDRMWLHLASEDRARSRDRLQRAYERERRRPTCGT